MKLHKLLDFFPSESGLADRQKGLAFGWLVAALGGVAAVIGSPKDVQATGACCSAKCDDIHYERRSFCPTGYFMACDCP